MSNTGRLHELGQRLWLDQITRTMLDDGTLRRYIDDLSITGLTSNPTIFAQALDKTGVKIPARSAAAGVDIATLAQRLQVEGTQAFVRSWQSLLQRIASAGSSSPRASREGAPS